MKKILKSTCIAVCLLAILIGLTGCKISLRDNKYKKICGNWQVNTKQGSCFTFEDDKTFYWYKSLDDKSDNYYKGKVEYYCGADALEELDISYENALKLFEYTKGKITTDDIYCLKLKPTYLISAGVDKTSNVEGKEMTLLFIYIDEDTAQAYNYNTMETYYLVKK